MNRAFDFLEDSWRLTQPLLCPAEPASSVPFTIVSVDFTRTTIELRVSPCIRARACVCRLAARWLASHCMTGRVKESREANIGHNISSRLLLSQRADRRMKRKMGEL